MPIKRTGTPTATGTTKAKTSTGTSAAGTSSAPSSPRRSAKTSSRRPAPPPSLIEYPTHNLQEDLLLAYNAVDTTNPQVDLSKPVGLHFSHGLAAIRFINQGQLRNRRQTHFVLLPERRYARLRNLRHVGLRLRDRNQKHLLEPGILPSRHREDLLLAKLRNHVLDRRTRIDNLGNRILRYGNNQRGPLHRKQRDGC